MTMPCVVNGISFAAGDAIGTTLHISSRVRGSKHRRVHHYVSFDSTELRTFKSYRFFLVNLKILPTHAGPGVEGKLLLVLLNGGSFMCPGKRLVGANLDWS
jgi:hypothetical protein